MCHAAFVKSIISTIARSKQSTRAAIRVEPVVMLMLSVTSGRQKPINKQSQNVFDCMAVNGSCGQPFGLGAGHAAWPWAGAWRPRGARHTVDRPSDTSRATPARRPPGAGASAGHCRAHRPQLQAARSRGGATHAIRLVAERCRQTAAIPIAAVRDVDLRHPAGQQVVGQMQPPVVPGAARPPLQCQRGPSGRPRPPSVGGSAVPTPRPRGLAGGGVGSPSLAPGARP